MQIHNKAMTRFKETYDRYQTQASEINTYRRLNRDKKPHKEEDRHEDDWRDPFFEFKDKRANTVKSELDRYLDEPLLPRDSKTSHLEVWKYWKSKHLSSRFSLRSLEIAFQFLPLLPPLSVFSVKEKIRSRKSVIESAEQIRDTSSVYDLGEYSLAMMILTRQKNRRKIEM